ncbi:MAG: hypothetical protein JXQ23_04025 [Clostridia bacterium]|nr:hypothetical protein [Clostridia bacterium]
MKSVVITKGNKKSVLLTSDGQFVNVRTKKQFQEGKETDYVNSHMKTLSIAAMFLMILSVATFLVAYNVTSYSVSMDVNPSIEFYANIFNQVIDVNGLNEDGNQIISNLDYKNKKLKEVLVEALAQIEELGYLKDDYVVVVGVDGNEKQVLGIQSVFDSLKESNEVASTQSENENGNGIAEKIQEQGTEIIVERITDEMRQAADDNNVSPGKILLITKANEQGADIPYDAATYLTVQEIQKVNNLLSSISKIEQSTASDNGTENGNKQQAMDQKIEKQLEKLENSTSELLDEIENDTIVENNALLDRYITLTEQIEKVYSKFNTEPVVTEEKTKSEGYEKAKAKIAQRIEEKALENQQSDDNTTKGNNSKSNSNKGGQSGKN